jgi:hypothetical protein
VGKKKGKSINITSPQEKNMEITSPQEKNMEITSPQEKKSKIASHHEKIKADINKHFQISQHTPRIYCRHFSTKHSFLTLFNQGTLKQS